MRPFRCCSKISFLSCKEHRIPEPNQAFAMWQRQCCPWEGVREEQTSGSWDMMTLPPDGRAVLTVWWCSRSPGKHPAQIQNRCTEAYPESLLSLSRPLLTFTLICLNFSLTMKALAGRSSDCLYLFPHTLKLQTSSTILAPSPETTS